MQYCRMHDTPVGPLFLAGEQDKLQFLLFDHDQRSSQYVQTEWQENTEPFRDVIRQLNEYFLGERQDFDVRLSPRGTEFQQQVWTALRDIPYGKTVTYSQIATTIAKPKACRAVGLANGRNPISIIVPCHRVIGANGSLVGYGGGLEHKQTLLYLEGVTLF